MASTLQFVRVIVRLRTNHYAVAQGILAGITMSSPIAIDLASVTQKRPRSERQGADKGEYLGLVHPEDRAFVEQQIQELLATHRAFDFTKRIVRPHGQIRSVRWVGVPASQGRTLQRFVGTGMDVTEQERLTQDLQRREAYLDEAQRLSHTGS